MRPAQAHSGKAAAQPRSNNLLKHHS